MKFSQNGIKFLGAEEGRRSKTYLDSGGAPTIGIGHLLTKSERTSGKIFITTLNTSVKYSQGLTEEQIDALLISDLIAVESTVNKNVYVPLLQCQYDALVSFTFNIGNSSFTESTLLKKVNQKMLDQVPIQMRRWIHDNGKVVKGLVNRREAEILLWANKWSAV